MELKFYSTQASAEKMKATIREEALAGLLCGEDTRITEVEEPQASKTTAKQRTWREFSPENMYTWQERKMHHQINIMGKPITTTEIAC